MAPESAAARAGLRPQDLIVQADSQPIFSASDLTAYVATRRAGDSITLTVMRWNGASHGRVQVTATLAPLPDQGNPGAASSAQNGPAPSAPAAAPAQGLTDVSWTTFTDPYENAFNIEVPRGWRVAGGVVKIPLWQLRGHRPRRCGPALRPVRRPVLRGWLGKTVTDKADLPLTFRLSSTMTRAGGKTIRTRIPRHDGPPKTHYEIAIASQMLFMTFNDIQRPVVVCGLTCTDRLQALQRIMEHEIIHLTELLVWGKSSCSAPRFRILVANIFGHADTKHDLVTPRERAAVQHGIKLGDLVGFESEGVRHVGRVNRIHHRATVLVEAADGMPYSDGKRYKKWYVPLAGLVSAPHVASPGTFP